MKTTIPSSNGIDAEFVRACTHKTFRAVKALNPTLIGNYIVADGNFPVISQAFSHIKTVKDRNAIVDFLQAIEKAVRSSNEDHMKFLILDSLHEADPALFFDFCKKSPLSHKEAATILKTIEREMNRRVPNRKVAVHLVCTYAIRRLLGDKTARSPLLVGPPGGGKSELVNQFTNALTDAGVVAKAIFQSMTQESSPHSLNEGAMRLLGTSKHFANGTPGNIYTNVSKPDVDMGIVLLDEADKTEQRDYLVGLLDPKTPLQDNFIREVVGDIDLRSKTLLLLTANDPAQLKRGPEDPLWSRMEPTFLQAYTREEMIGLAVEIISSDNDNPFQPTRKMVRKLAKETVAELGIEVSFRAILDQVNNKIFHAVFELDKSAEEECQHDFVPTKKLIGFRA